MFTSTWGAGHVFPMVPLAKAFLAAGHEVYWVASEVACSLVQAAGIDAEVGGLNAVQVRQAVAEMKEVTAPAPAQDRAAIAFPTMFGSAATPVMVKDLLRIVRRWKPDMIIHEPAELASPIVSALFGIPCITHAWGPAIPSPILSAAGTRVEHLWAEHGLSVPPFAGLFANGYLDLCPASLQFVSIEHIVHPQPLRPVPYSGESRGELPVDLQDSRPLVYVTLGTVFSDYDVLQAAIDGAVGCGAQVLVGVGPSADPNRIVVRSTGVRVERWVPQPDVFGVADAVISHTGSGTFLGVLSAGLPQLCLPQGADQFRNAHAVTRTGTGIVLPPSEVTAAEVTHSLRLILDDRSYRVAASRIASDLAAMPDPADVVEQLVANH